MRLIHFGLLLLVFILLTAAETAAMIYAKPGCKDTCGNVKIPYPFGIGEACSINRWFSIDCNSSKPYLPAVNNLEVLYVDFIFRLVILNTPVTSFRPNPLENNSRIFELDVSESPFLVDRHNRFIFHGCGSAALSRQGVVLTNCSTDCRSNNTVHKGDSIECNGVNCCQTSIPHFARNYSVDVRGSGYGFLVDENWYAQGRFVIGNNSFVPMRFHWIVNTRIDAPNCYNSPMLLGNGESVDNWRCYGCTDATLDENPYLTYGCQYTEQCTRCEKRGGVCNYVDVSGGPIFKCHGGNWWTSHHKALWIIILGVGLSMGVLVLLASSFTLYKVVKRMKQNRRRKKYFKRNGGKLLEQQQAADEGLVDKTILFTEKVLKKATENFNENRILGRGGQGIVYKGMLTDGKIVAVKRSKLVHESQLKVFINEVVILSQVNHRNVVRLLGCCLETEVPLLVYEFISNGTLHDYLHQETNEFLVSIKMRLQIATEVAGALSYLHSAISTPIYHRDIKTTNILLDDKYQAKISDFGTSRLILKDQTHLTTKVMGTFGYLDPEYYQSSQFTEKSDVYSFGVVLAELLTGERPISVIRFGEHRNLAMHFKSAMDKGQVMSILDATVLKEGNRDEVLAMANVAMRCLDSNGKNRPTMKEVASELEGIRKSHVQTSAIRTNFGKMKYSYNFGEDELSPLSSDDSTSTMNFSGSIISDNESNRLSKRDSTMRSLSLNLRGCIYKSDKRERINPYSRLWTQ